ncbi:MAG: hypothetical protein K2X44_00030 [Magnetospirillum sp.]|nr:hypothetical protein [Magnetospirillum sp.]
MKKLLLGTLTAMLLAGPALADSASAIRAYNSGLYDIAAQEFEREAKAGDTEAQFRLGSMYADGIWLKQDHSQAITWLGKAAMTGHQGAVKKLEALNRAQAPAPYK